ncbi:MAG: methionine--tRNA ligase, partial [Actinomycetes bacterium]|nr:methionine--tRNA ligase [Actinomycetes bacterium]MDX5380795.1 methionine--tRNA ligase [Actinomycetes bacterium]MDX5399836.1 methionine--tRNA ligase [Actinomycetes bacterium]MDX5450538.1 methionine--tRNA ligase [Actinomycetes bacterium]
YVADTEPFKMKAPEQRERLATVLHTLAQAVSNLNVMFAPYLPHSANAIDALFGGDGALAPLPRIEQVEDLGDGPAYPVITGEYSDTPPWAPRPVVVGTPVAKPIPVFTKLDEAIVEEEIERMGGRG